jgi:hypothetical protein
MSTEEKEPGAQSQAQEAPKTYSEDYVKELRNENAARRVREKELADKLAKIEEATAADQGKYKELYEKQQERLKAVDEQTAELEAYRQSTIAEIDILKKGMDKDTAKMLDELPANLTARQRLEWARKLAGNKPNLPAQERPGAAQESGGTTDTVIEAYRKSSKAERVGMLLKYKQSNPKLYEQLLAVQV